MFWVSVEAMGVRDAREECGHVSHRGGTIAI
jgi:hypothetical protein